MSHISIHVPAHKRRQIARIAFTALERTRSEFHELGYTTSVHVGGYTKHDRELAEEFKYEFRLVPNRPLGRKFDLLAKHIHSTTKYEWFMEYCTDNVLAEGYAQRAHQEMQKPETYQVGLTSFYVVSLDDCRINVFRNGYSNVGRLTRRHIIQAALVGQKELVTHRLERRLDSSFAKHTRRAAKTAPTKIDDGIWLLDIKSNININARSGYKEKSLSLDKSFPEFTNAHPSTWPPPQEKSEATASASTSPTQPDPSPLPQTEHGATKPGPRMTTGSSSRAPRAARSAAPSKSSTRRPKTTTGKGKSSRAGSNGA